MRAIAWLLLIVLGDAVAAPQGKPVGIVVDLSGPVFVTRADGERSAVKQGDGIWPEDEIATGDGASIVVSRPRAAERFKRLGANAVWRVEHDAAAEIPWAPARTGARRAATSRGDGAAATLQLPRNTRLAALPLRLSWRNALPQLGEATLVVRTHDGIVAATLTGNGRVEIPAAAGWSTERLYCWQLMAPSGDIAPARGSFSLLADERVRHVQRRLDVETPRADADDVHGMLLVQLAVLVDEALYVDAAQRLVNSELARRNPRLYERLLLELAALSSTVDPACP